MQCPKCHHTPVYQQMDTSTGYVITISICPACGWKKRQNDGMATWYAFRQAQRRGCWERIKRLWL